MTRPWWGRVTKTILKKTAFAVFFVSGTAMLPALATAQSTAPEGISLSTGAARQVARQALEKGDLTIARGIAEAFIARDPEDYQARIVLALVAQRQGNLDAAFDNARRAYSSARSDPQRFESAWLSANILGAQEKWERSKLWLRRADQAAPNEAAEQRVGQAFRMARARSPWSIQLTFALRPTDNLNNGSDPNSVDDGGFLTGSTEGKIGGTEASGSVSVRYRISESETARTDAFLQTYVRLAFPDSGFEDIAPDASRREFDYVTLLGGLSHERALFDGMGPTGVRFGYGASYYRNQQLNSFATLGLSQIVPLSKTQSLRFGLDFRDESRKDSPAASYFSRGVSVDWSGRVNSDVALGFGVAFTDYSSTAATVRGDRIELRGTARFAQKILGATPDLRVSISYRDLPDFFNPLNAAAGVGREDVTKQMTLGLTFNDATWYGFVPRVETRLTDTSSDRVLFDRDAWSIGATLVSRF